MPTADSRMDLTRGRRMMNGQLEFNPHPVLRGGVIRRPGGAGRGVARVEYRPAAPPPGRLSWPSSRAGHPAPPTASTHDPAAASGFDRPQWRRGWRRAVQAVTAGLLRPGGDHGITEERALVARVRSRHRHPRVVAVLAGKGGVGTSTTAAATAMVLATLRHDPTALLDPRHGTGSLGLRLAGRPAPTIEQLTTAPPAGRAAAPLRINGSLDVVDGAPWHSPVAADRLGGTLDALRDSHALTIVDVGNHPADNTRLILGRTDQMVVVVGATRDAVESARVALSRVLSVAPVLLSSVVVAVPSVASSAGHGDPARLAAGLGVPERRVVAVPYDPALVHGGAIALREMRPATCTAFLRLAGMVADPDERT